MKNLFVNLTNHPVAKFQNKQLQAAQALGEVQEIKFPQIDPHASTNDVHTLAASYLSDILNNSKEFAHVYVQIMGEMVFTASFVHQSMMHDNITCIASTTDRQVVEIEMEDGTIEKKTTFDFVQFRKY